MRSINIKKFYSAIKSIHLEIFTFLLENKFYIDQVFVNLNDDKTSHITEVEQTFAIEFKTKLLDYLKTIEHYENELQIVRGNGGENLEWYEITEQTWSLKTELVKIKLFRLRVYRNYDEIFGGKSEEGEMYCETVKLIVD